MLATLEILRARLGQPTDVILKRALEALDAHLNPASVEEIPQIRTHSVPAEIMVFHQHQTDGRATPAGSP